MRGKINGDCFKVVKSYAISKGLVVDNSRKKGAQDLANVVRNAYLKQLATEFQRWQDKSGGNDQKNATLKRVYNQVIAGRMRDAFTWWKRKHELEELKKDLYECGPVRAEHWLAEREIDNLLDFMKSEKYTENERRKFYDDVCGTNDYLMKKYILRLKIR